VNSCEKNTIPSTSNCTGNWDKFHSNELYSTSASPLFKTFTSAGIKGNFIIIHVEKAVYWINAILFYVINPHFHTAVLYNINTIK